MSWILLVVAGVLEIGWAIGLKYTEGWTKPVPSLITLAIMGASFYSLSQAVKPGAIPIGTGYAVWTGIGAVGTALLGMLIFQEPINATRLLCIAAIVGGIVGLKLTSGPAVCD